jgi:hypothetical protein
MIDSSLGEVFDHSIELIEAAYTRLGHAMGWRFLLGPRATLSPRTRIALLSSNPAGTGNPLKHPSASRETGSAYLDERWPGHAPGDAPLQRQIQGLCSALQHALGDQTPMRTFMAQRLLAAHFVPFRSPDFASLPRRQESVQFARQLWGGVLTAWQPRLIITLDRETFDCISALVQQRGVRVIERREWPSGWGGCKCESTRYGGPVTLARLPHLARFRLFGRAASASQMSSLIAYLCAGLSG